MPIPVSKINSFLLFKLPSCYFSGVRVKTISEITCTTSVKHKWINQNPFNSLYFAVQAMAAELSTGALVMSCIKEKNAKVSMLVANNKANFSKKATGRITFSCHDGLAIKEAIDRTIETGDGQTCWMKSQGVDEQGDVVSTFEFEWTVKKKS
ncbi:DUF4442 domain-containing protein [Jejudonia soesokkakensis]|uniref:DUF4442 domain-containing protein n=1 Tax=Jejudonia soesokkakensis TaxID=1323432 RepID=A0ABW2MX85_9FLAO